MTVSTDEVDQASGFANGRRRFKASLEYPNSRTTSLLCSPIETRWTHKQLVAFNSYLDCVVAPA